MSTAAITAVDLTKMWSPLAGLRPISFDVPAGELVVVRGRSGTGKSTLLALLAGLSRPDSGAVTVDGAVPSLDLPWERVAFVPQVLALALELSVRENIADASRHLDDAALAAHIDGVMTRLDLHDFADRCVDEVSMGQQQRTAVARACVAGPRVLLVDEPTSFQDGRHAQAVIDELRRLAADGAAVVVATHDQAVVDAADRVIDLAHDDD